MHNKDPWFDDQCRSAFGLKQEAHLRWTRDRSLINWKEFVRCPMRVNETYSKAKGQFCVRNGEFLRTPCSIIRGGPLLSLQCSDRIRYCLCLLVEEVDWRCEELFGKADQLSDHFDSNSPGSLLICRSLASIS